MKLEFQGILKEVQKSKFAGNYEIYTMLVSEFYLDANRDRKEKIYAIKVFVKGVNTTQTFMNQYIGMMCKFICYWGSNKSKTSEDWYNDVTLGSIEPVEQKKPNSSPQQRMTFEDEQKQYASSTIDQQGEDSKIKIQDQFPIQMTGEEPDDLPF